MFEIEKSKFVSLRLVSWIPIAPNPITPKVILSSFFPLVKSPISLHFYWHEKSTGFLLSKSKISPLDVMPLTHAVLLLPAGHLILQKDGSIAFNFCRARIANLYHICSFRFFSYCPLSCLFLAYSSFKLKTKMILEINPRFCIWTIAM